MKKIVYLLLVIAVFLLVGCSEKKNPIGYQIDPGNHLLSVETEVSADSLATASFFVEDYIRRSISHLIVGKRNSLEVRSLLKLTGLPGMPTDSVSILSAKLILQKNEILNDESFYVEVRKISTPWTIGEADWEQGNDENPWENEGGDFSSNNYGSYEVSSADSLVEIELSPTWMQYSITDTTFYGLALIPFGDIENIVSFERYTSGTAYPSLEINYIRTNEEEPDTITANYANLSGTCIYNKTFEQPFVDTTAFVVNNIFPMKGLVSLPLSSDIFVDEMGEPVLDMQTVMINQAVLELPITEKEILHSFDVTAFTCFSEWHGSDTDYDLGDLINEYQSVSAESDTLRLDITQTVQDWMAGLYENHGIVVHSWGEGATYGYIKCGESGVLKLVYSFTSEEE